MKKKYLIILIIVGFLLSGCGQEEILEPNTENFTEVKDTISYRFKELEISNEMRARLGKSMQYKPLDNTKQFLDLILEVETLANSEILVDDIFEGSKFIINEKEFNISPFTEENSFTSISNFSYLMPQSSTLIHLATEVNPDELPDVFNLELVINNEKKLFELDKNELQPKKTLIKKGDTFSLDEKYKLSFIDFEVNNTVKPSDTSDTYRYYQAKGDNTYAVAKMEIINQSGNDLYLDELINTSIIIDDKYKFEGFTVIETDGDLSAFDTIKPMQETLVYSIIEFPTKLEKNKIEFKINTEKINNYYLLNE